MSANEAHLQALLDNISCGVIVHGADTHIIDANPAAHRITGLSEDQMRGKVAIDPFWCFLEEDGSVMPLERYPVQQVLSSGSAVKKMIMGMRRPDLPEPTWGQVDAYPLRDEQGRIERVVVTFADFTDLRKALAEQARMAAMVEGASDAIIGFDAAGLIQSWNSAAEALLGYRTEDIVGCSIEILREPSGKGKLSAGLAKLGHGGSFEDEDALALRQDGSPVNVWVRATPIRDARGQIVGGCAVLRDISERKLVEAAREAMELQLYELQKMEAIGTLAGGIAHDFNNIIATMLGNADLARRSLDHEHAALQCIDEIVKAGRRARDLVRQILTFSRRQVTDMTTFALESLVHEVVKMLSVNLPARIHIEVKADADVPHIRADSTQMMQVLMNLGTNAIQAMREHGGTLCFAVEAVASSLPAQAGLHYQVQPAVRLTVRDSGSGMDQATLDRMYEPFFTTKPPGEGTGLGLAVVHGIVKFHGGLIDVSSNPGSGTSFTIDLPAASGMPDAGQQVAAAPQVIAPTLTKSGAGRHILYLDDDDSLVFLVRRLLEIEGFKVSAFSEQSEAIAAVKANGDTFDLVITDFNMPGMNGIEVVQEMLTINPALRTAIASGFVDEALTEAARQVGVTKLIFKESAIEDFCEVIRGLIKEPI